MEYAAPRLTRSPSRQSIVVPLVALVLGAGVATGTYALIDNGSSPDSQVVVVQRPTTADIAGKNEAATAHAISQQVPQTASHPNEAATAASISNEQSGVQLRGSKASVTGIPSPAAATATAEQRARDLREDPHGTANQLHSP